jgi:hypothetical protein
MEGGGPPPPGLPQLLTSNQSRDRKKHVRCSNFQLPTSNFQLPTSNFQLPASGFYQIKSAEKTFTVSRQRRYWLLAFSPLLSTVTCSNLAPAPPASRPFEQIVPVSAFSIICSPHFHAKNRGF